MKLSQSYYKQEDIIGLSRDLLGKVLCTNISGQFTSGIICETEAYAGVIDKASHAYGGLRTKRTETMYLAGGVSYVYLCYGIHYLFNVVSNQKEVPHAALIRGIVPLEGIALMKSRRKVKKWDTNACIGPGKLSQALGINKAHNELDLEGNIIWIEDRGISVIKNDIVAGPRVGVDYAEEDALLPYRFQYMNFAIQE